MSRLRNFVFTINNWTEQNEYELMAIPCEYIVWGYEVGESGTPHMQGYCELETQQYFTRVKEWIPTAHIEPRRGTQTQAIKYCKKDGLWVEYGVPKQQGRRTDLNELMTDIKNKTPTIDIMELHPELYAKNMRFCEKYATLVEREETKEFRTVSTTVLWSEEGGVGKTRTAREYDKNIFTVNPEDTFPFDGYAGEKTILIDDFEGQGIMYKHLLKILDGHQLRVNVKGGHRYAQWNKVFITANKPPERWYHHGMTQPLARRLTEIVQLTSS